MRYHYIWEFVIEKKLEVRNVDTKVNIVDNLMKPLLDQRFEALRKHMELQQAKENGKAESDKAEEELKPEKTD